MAKVTFFYGENDFKANISLNEEELQGLRWILINSKSLMKLWDKDHKQNTYDEERFNIEKLLKAIRNAENKFED